MKDVLQKRCWKGIRRQFGNQKLKNEDESRDTIRLREEKEEKEKGRKNKKKQEG